MRDHPRIPLDLPEYVRRVRTTGFAARPVDEYVELGRRIHLGERARELDA